MTLDKTAKGKFSPKNQVDTTKYIRISRREFRRPIIHVESFDWIDNPCKESIQSKCYQDAIVFVNRRTFSYK